MTFKCLLIFFLIYIISDCYCYNDPPARRPIVQRRVDDVTKNRSAVCLINQLAQRNNITAKFTCSDHIATTAPTPAVTSPRPPTYECRLNLGRETYRASASSQRSSKEKVSRQAYSETSYTKPRLKERTCAQTNIKTNVSLIYEYASVKGKTVFDKVTHLSTRPNKFRVELRLDSKSISEDGYSIKEAKNKAAASLMIIIGRENVLTEITEKFNDAKYLDLKNVDRLNLIFAARGEPEPEIKFDDEVSDPTGARSSLICKVFTSDAIYTGSGLSLDDAREDAARNYLRALNFEVKK